MAQAKPTTEGAVDLQDSATAKAPDYLQASSGRVFKATPYLVKQWRKGKFGMVKATKKDYDDAVKAEAAKAKEA